MLHAIRLVLAPPHRAGWPFIAAGLALAASGALISPLLAGAGLAFAAFSLFFFRDPDRVAPDMPGALLAPADGRIVSVAQAVPPAELGLGAAPRWRIGIFLSVLDVHVNRVPAAGHVTAIAYRTGRFMNASLDKASEANERNAIAFRLAGGRDCAVVQIAGLIARRISCALRAGDAVEAGERLGLIRFGSRTDLYLPEGVVPVVRAGMRAVGGETVCALLPAAGDAAPAG